MLNSKEVYTEQLILKELVETLEERFEYINGKAYLIPSPSLEHQTISIGLSSMIRDFIRQNNLGYKVYTAPASIYLLDDTNYVQPDVSIVCDRSKLGKNGVHGAPDLTMEIISPSTKKKDEEEKLRLYRKAGVKEYWIIDFKEDQVRVYDFTNSISWGCSFSDTVKSKLFPDLEFDFNEIKEDLN